MDLAVIALAGLVVLVALAVLVVVVQRRRRAGGVIVADTASTGAGSTAGSTGEARRPS